MLWEMHRLLDQGLQHAINEMKPHASRLRDGVVVIHCADRMAQADTL